MQTSIYRYLSLCFLFICLATFDSCDDDGDEYKTNEAQHLDHATEDFNFAIPSNIHQIAGQDQYERDRDDHCRG